MKEELLNSRWGRAEQPDPGAAARLCARVESESYSTRPGYGNSSSVRSEPGWALDAATHGKYSAINNKSTLQCWGKVVWISVLFCRKKEKKQRTACITFYCGWNPWRKKTKQNQLKTELNSFANRGADQPGRKLQPGPCTTAITKPQTRILHCHGKKDLGCSQFLGFWA